MTHWKTLEAAERAFRRAWRRADEAGREGSRTREGLVAAFAVAGVLESPEGPPVEEVFAALEGRSSAPEGVPDTEPEEEAGPELDPGTSLQKGDRVEILPGAFWRCGGSSLSVPGGEIGVPGEVTNPSDRDGDVRISLDNGAIAWADPAHVRRLP